jgi:hypothetical protein
MRSPEETLAALVGLVVPGAPPARLGDVRSASLRAALAEAAGDPAGWLADAAEARTPAFVELRRLAWEAYFSTDAAYAAFGAPRHPKRGA